MARRRYTLPTGEVVRQANIHHVMYEDGWYTSAEEKRFKNLGGLVLPMFPPFHNFGRNALHPNVPPPPKPSRALMQQVEAFSHDIYDGEKLDAFFKIAHFIGDVANSARSPERADEAFRLHTNLMAQAPYIEAGFVVPLLEVA